MKQFSEKTKKLIKKEWKFFSLFWNFYSLVSVAMLLISASIIVTISIQTFCFNKFESEVAFTCIGVIFPVIFVPFFISIVNKIFYIRKILLSNKNESIIGAAKTNLVDRAFLEKQANKIMQKLTVKKKKKPLAVMGNFGSGKSEFIKLVNKISNKKYKNRAKVYKFETLKYDDYSDPFMVLISFLISNSILSWKTSRKIMKLIVSSNTGFLNRFMRSESFSIIQHNIQSKIIKTIVDNEVDNIKKIIVIDELDRTEPWFAYKILEIASIYLSDAKSLRFVFTISDKPFREMLSQKYGKADNNRFLNKFISTNENVRLRVADYLDYVAEKDIENNKGDSKEMLSIHASIQNCITSLGYPDEELSYRRYDSLYKKAEEFVDDLKSGPFSEYVAFGLVVNEFGNNDFKSDYRSLSQRGAWKNDFFESFTYELSSNDYPINDLGVSGKIKFILDAIERQQVKTHVLENKVYKFEPAERKYTTIVGEADNAIFKIEQWNNILSDVNRIKDYKYIPILEEKKRIFEYIEKKISIEKTKLKNIKSIYRKMDLRSKRHARLIEVKKWI